MMLPKRNMEKQEHKFYVTTPIYYVNDVPHIGHAYTTVLADVLVRYHRLVGDASYFLTGTDEHGAKVCRGAEEKGQDVEKFVDENAQKFEELTKILQVSNDDFIRTTDQKKHWPGVEKFWKILNEKGDVYKGNYKGLYCVGCEAFVTEKDLVNGKCVDHDKEPEMIEEENYFFKLSKYGDELKKVIETGQFKIHPESKKNEVLAFINEGLKDVSISRPAKDIKWGIPIPWDDTQTIYVWAEALINYISALGYGEPALPAGGDEKLFKKFWPADVHVMAKEITRFHITMWPAMLLSAGIELPKSFLVHGFILSGGKKMSKSVGNVVDPFDVVSRYGADALRYYFVREISQFEDGDFTEEKFKEAYNANLANGLGNYVSRVFKMAFSYFDGKVKKPSDTLLSQVPLKEGDRELFSVPHVFEHSTWKEYKEYLENLEINKAADLSWAAISQLDNYVQDYEPFKMIQSDEEKTQAVLWSLLVGLANIAWMIYPFIPETAEKIMEGLGIKNKIEELGDFSLKEIEALFPRKE
ncbi:methionine--tRNA ligase [Patescibacteria group bacterium]